MSAVEEIQEPNTYEYLPYIPDFSNSAKLGRQIKEVY